jgi:hypothetical protein
VIQFNGLARLIRLLGVQTQDSRIFRPDECPRESHASEISGSELHVIETVSVKKLRSLEKAMTAQEYFERISVRKVQ